MPVPNEEFADQIIAATARARGAVARILRNQNDVEDVLQEARLKIIQKFSTFQGRSKFATWAYVICTRTALQRVRGRAYEFTEFSETDFHSRELSPEQSARNTQLRRVLTAHIQKLTPKRREAVLRLFLGHETSSSAQKGRLHQARVVLKQQLSEVRHGL